MARGISRVLDTVLVLAALSSTVLMWKRSTSAAPADERAKPIVVKNWRDELAFPRRVGDARAPLQLVVWTDYQCPACRQMEVELARLRERLKDSLSIVYRYYPLPSHPLAFDAALAAECANSRGGFARMHDALFAVRLRGDSVPIDSLARLVPVLSSAELRACVAQPEIRAIVQRDLDRGNALGFRGTPYLQIGDELSLGGMPADQLDSLLRRALR